MFKSFLIVLSLLLISFFSNAQYEDYQVDSIVIHKQYNQKTVEGLSNEIAKDFEDRRCLIRAFYIYITYNMVYDVKVGLENAKRAYSIETDEDLRKGNEQEILKLLRTKRGVCWHFGNLFAELCAVQGIDVELIAGTRRTKQLPDKLSLNHLWNAVEIDGEMKMIDCTFDHSMPYKKEDFDQYFLVDPEVFIYSNIPMEPEKQYLDTPISYEAFKRLVWPYKMFNLLNVKNLTPRFKNILPRNSGNTTINFKMENFKQIDSLEIFVNNKLVQSIPADKPFVSIPIPFRSLSWISIQAVKYKNGSRFYWSLLNYDVLE
jgi:hypothetical protein